MRQAVGNAFVLNLVITFIALMMLVFVGSISYSKSYKVKNRIINLIENNKGYDQDVSDDIEEVLSDVGYQISNNQNCDKYKVNKDSKVVYPTSEFRSGYRYCIIENKTNTGKYYTVVAFMKFEFPVIGNYVEFPVKGETKIMSSLWN